MVNEREDRWDERVSQAQAQTIALVSRCHSQGHTKRKTPEPEHPLAIGFVYPTTTAPFCGFLELHLGVKALGDVIGLVGEEDASKSDPLSANRGLVGQSDLKNGVGGSHSLHLAHETAQGPADEPVPRTEPRRDIDLDVGPFLR